MKIPSVWRERNRLTLFCGDCAALLKSLPDESVDLVVTSPPYCIGKVYENQRHASDFIANHKSVLPEVVRVTRAGGSICWQVGYHVSNGVVLPLDFVVYQILSEFPTVQLRNRIIWTFGHGLHPTRRFSGRHETVLWFTKGDNFVFNLDAVRVPQKDPGKKAYKGDRKGQFSGNPLGKNPSDVWEIPNVNANHVEKADHPCQFPVALASRLIGALTDENDLVLDPYAGTGSTGAAASLLGRRFVGAEIEPRYQEIALLRLGAARQNNLKFRPEDKPVYRPPPNTPLTRTPAAWSAAI